MRSGLLTSVHSFASDPARGIFILFILLGAVGLPLFLYGLRAGRLGRASDYHLLSRETGLILNNYILVVSTFIVLIGTFYPLGLELFTGAKITVGAPYFDAAFNPVMGIGILFMAIGPLWYGGAGLLLLPGQRFICLLAAYCQRLFCCWFFQGYRWLALPASR